MKSTWLAADGLRLFGRIQTIVGEFRSVAAVAVLLTGLITGLVLFTDAWGDTSGGVSPTAYNPPPHLHVVIEDDLVSLEARSVPVGDVLAELARHSKLDIVADGPVDESITIELKRAPLPGALHRILRHFDYALQYNSNEAGGHSSTAKPRRTLWIFSTSRENDGQIVPGDDLQRNSTDVDFLNNAQILNNIVQLEHHEALVQLNLALTDEEPGVRKEAIEILASIGGEEATRFLGAALYDPNTSVREAAVQALGEIGGNDTISFLQQALADDDAGVRMAAVESASDIGGEESSRLLGFALQNENAAVRETAVYELGNTGSVDVIPLIESVLTDRNPQVRETAREVLEHLSTTETP